MNLKVKSWLDYNAEFSELIPQMRGAKLELQFGEGAENWSISNLDKCVRTEFLNICAQAGGALVDVHLQNHETGSKVEPEVRWFRFLRERANPDNVHPILFDNNGVALFEWSHTDTAELSANLCYSLQKTKPIMLSTNWFISKYKQDPVGSLLKALGVMLLSFVILLLLSR